MGWTLALRLFGKQVDNVGDDISTAIAMYDPETATEVDREVLVEKLRACGIKLATARSAYEKEQKDVTDLEALIASDNQVATKLAERLAAGEISEEQVTRFCDELEAQQQRLPQEKQEAEDALSYYEQIKEAVDLVSKDLAEFDGLAKKTLQMAASAKAQKDLQEMRLQRQAELNSLKTVGKSSTALAALSKKAASLKAEAEGLKTVADIQQKPLDDKKALDDIRKSVMAPAVESASERLARLTGKV